MLSKPTKWEEQDAAFEKLAAAVAAAVEEAVRT
jgi:hypothetical protein